MTVLMLQASLALANPGQAIVSATADGGALNLSTIGRVPPKVGYYEFCYDGTHTVSWDENIGGASPAGGRCEPGDFGFVVTSETFGPASFFFARADCARLGMRIATGEELAQLNLYPDLGGFELAIAPNTWATNNYPDAGGDVTTWAGRQDHGTPGPYHCAR